MTHSPTDGIRTAWYMLDAPPDRLVWRVRVAVLAVVLAVLGVACDTTPRPHVVAAHTATTTTVTTHPTTDAEADAATATYCAVIDDATLSNLRTAGHATDYADGVWRVDGVVVFDGATSEDDGAFYGCPFDGDTPRPDVLAAIRAAQP